MGHQIPHARFWALVRKQFGVISHRQLVEFGFSPDAIKHRIANGRLHRIWPGVYSVGRPELTREGCWMAAILAGGEGAALSHASAAALWGIHPTGRRLASAGVTPIHISIPVNREVDLDGIDAHRRRRMPSTTTKCGIPLTQPLFTLLDLAPHLSDRKLEAAVNEADKLGLIKPKRAARTLANHPRAPGISRLRRILGDHKRTDSDLERDFLRLIRKAGLPEPQTQQRVSGHRVDFYWPDLNLVVETDGTKYHRTPTQQIRDRRRDQAHARAGLTALRFLDLQIDNEPDEVIKTLRATIQQLQ